MSRYWIGIRLCQIGIDMILIYGAFLLAYFIRVEWIFSTDFEFLPYAIISLFATFVWSGVLLLAKYYRLPPRSGKRQIFDIFLTVFAGAMASSVVLLVFLFQREEIFSRAIMLWAFVFGVGALFVTREMVYGVFRSLKKNEKHVYHTLIVGANRMAGHLIKDIETNAYAPYKVVGVLDPYGIAKRFEQAPLLGKLNVLEKVCEKHKVERIIQCDAFEHTINLISFCQEKDIGFQFASALRGINEDSLRMREVAGNTLISFVQREKGGTKGLWFRCVDVVLRQVFNID